MFLSALLLFSVQPMFAKMIVFLLGGSPAVWNVCMVFFQFTLLAGYLYAHSVTSIRIKYQILIHLGLLLVALWVLPIRVPEGWTPPAEVDPTTWLLGLLFVSVGLPFFVVSTTAPLLQKWFSNTDHPSAEDPYFLYAASSLGSLLGLLTYPFVVEPALSVPTQSLYWTWSYGLFIVLFLTCMTILWRSQRRTGLEAKAPAQTSRLPVESDEPVAVRQRLRWTVLAFVPSSLMLGITAFISTDVASIPLIWVLPLSLYLLTFSLVFARRPLLPHSFMVRASAFLVIPLAMYFVAHLRNPAWVVLTVHLLGFFAIAMVCHGELAKGRPAAKHLTEFYLCISVGGFSGGIFNALVAPLIFNNVYEYPLIFILACFLRPDVESQQSRRRLEFKDLIAPVSVGLICVAFSFLTFWTDSSILPGKTQVVLSLTVPALACFIFRNRTASFALAIAAFLGVSAMMPAILSEQERVIFRDRSFFGVSMVIDNREKDQRYYVHGTTVHGMQFLDSERRKIPLAYFHPDGPAGQVLQSLPNMETIQNVATIGLGAGSLAYYAKPGQKWDFYEIDPVVKKIASDPNLFTYLQDSPGEVRVVLGDGRLSLKRAPENYYGIVIMDAFSSDSIPVHLVTREAVQMYLTKLTDQGILIINISNRYFDMRPVMSSLAEDAGLVCYVRSDIVSEDDQNSSGKTTSTWIAMARSKECLSPITQDPRWVQLKDYRESSLWTDSHSNIIDVLKWN